MTPSKEKKPLPVSQSTTHWYKWPKSYEQWRVCLKAIKSLYLQQQWKDCIMQCSRLLSDGGQSPHPVHKSYLCFFSAISAELIARSIPTLSLSQLSLLASAKESYETALAVLPRSEEATAFVQEYDRSNRDSSNQSATWSTPSTLIPMSETAITPPSSPSSTYSDDEPPIQMPLPLRIRKLTINDADTSTKSTPTPVSFRVMLQDTGQPLNPSISLAAFFETRTRQRYNTFLADFTQMLTHHVDRTDELMQSTKTALENRRNGTKPPSFCENEETKNLDRRLRIEKLKAKGWIRERFQPHKYQLLCAKALSELCE